MANPWSLVVTIGDREYHLIDFETDIEPIVVDVSKVGTVREREAIGRKLTLTGVILSEVKAAKA